MRYVFGQYRLDTALRELRRAGKTVHVEPQVFDLIVHLVRNRERVMSHDDLLDSVWGGRIVSESALRSRINAARRVLGDSGKRQAIIRTVARRGIRFIGEVREEAGEGGDGPASALDAARPVPVGDNAGEPVGQDISAAGPADAPGDDRGRPAIAVLPFANPDGNPEWDHYADGITGDVTTALAKHRTLFVISRTSAFAFKGYSTDVRRVGQALGADYMVEGSVRKVGHRVRVTAHLVESESGRLIWADHYDEDLESIFDVLDAMTGMITSSIEPRIGTAERRRAERKTPSSFRAWDLFHLGTKHLYKATPQDNLEAQRLLRRAIEHDTGLAPAYAHLSYAILLSMLYFDADPDQGRLREAWTLARKGIELDEEDALIRFVYGRVLLARRNYADALEELRQAVEMNPALAVGYCGVGDSLAYDGRFDEAMPYFQKAIDLSPHDPQRWAFCAYRALAHLFARQFEESLEWSGKAIRVPNCHYWPYSHRVSALGHLQCPDELAPAIETLFERKPDFTREVARKRLFYIRNEAQTELYLEGLRMAGIPP